MNRHADEQHEPTRSAEGRANGADDTDDDRPVGRVLKRREVLLLLGAGAALSAFGVAEAAGFPFGRGRRQSAQPGQTASQGPGAGSAAATQSSAGKSYEFTSQLFFDDALSDEVYTTQTPYTNRGTGGRTRNAQDGIYRNGGSQLVLAPTRTADGYTAAFPIALQLP